MRRNESRCNNSDQVQRGHSVFRHLRDDESSCSSGLERQGLDTAPDKTELMKSTADRLRNMAPHGEVILQHDAKITHRGRRRDRSPADAQRAGVEVEAPSAG